MPRGLSPLYDAAYWRARAATARALADSFADPTSARIMLALAASFDRAADRAEHLTPLHRSHTTTRLAALFACVSAFNLA